MKRPNKAFAVAALVASLAASGVAQSHGIWFAQRATQLALLYGVGADDLDIVKRFSQVTSMKGYDADGKVYVSNGWADTPATNGRVWAFSPDLHSLLFTLVLDRQNSGGPSLAADGTLIVADRQGVFAYRGTTATPTPTPTATPTATPTPTATVTATAIATATPTVIPRQTPAARPRPTPAPRPIPPQ